VYLHRRNPEDIQVDRQKHKSAHTDRPHHRHHKRDTRNQHRRILVVRHGGKAGLRTTAERASADMVLYRTRRVEPDVMWLSQTEGVDGGMETGVHAVCSCAP
jgi:hypothetical protein